MLSWATISKPDDPAALNLLSKRIISDISISNVIKNGNFVYVGVNVMYIKSVSALWSLNLL